MFGHNLLKRNLDKQAKFRAEEKGPSLDRTGPPPVGEVWVHVCAHCLILTARIKRAKDSSGDTTCPRCQGKHSGKGQLNALPPFVLPLRPLAFALLKWRQKLQQILIFIMQTLL